MSYRYDDLQIKQSRSKSKSPGRRRRAPHEEPSNSSILLGANIIKRQLSTDSPTGSLPQSQSRSRKSPSRKTANNNVGLTSIDNENWDPWMTEQEVKRSDLRDRILEYNSATRSRVEEILKNGDEYFDDREKNVGTVACAPLEGIQNREPQDGKRGTNNLNCAMVQRVSDLDNSSFASSSMANGYLPNNLISGLTCGGLNNTLNGTLANTLTSTMTNTLKNNNITNCASPQQPSGSDLDPLSRQLFGNPTTQAKSKASSIDEELETSTLDFLANLHVKEEDMRFAFNTPQVELCAQSGIPFLEEPQFCSSENMVENAVTSSSYVTAASVPFEKMLSSRSSLHDQLVKNPAYIHALKAGTLWQSLCSQHVRFPAHWWDGQEPVGPPLGSSKKRSKPWSYLGRHRVQGDNTLNKAIGNRASSGRILLHLIVRDDISGEPIEDIACGCYHPNARGVRSTQHFDPALEKCRDVWIAHRRRFQDLIFVPDENDGVADDKFSWTTIESLLHHQNKGRVHLSPLGAQGGKHSINNENMRTVFGSKPPVRTVFCLESDLFQLFQNKLDGTIPASVALLRHYLRYQMS